MLPDCSETKVKNVQKCGYVFHDTNGQNHGLTLKAQWYLLNEICTVTHSHASCGKGSSRKFNGDVDGKKVPNWECLFFHLKPGLFLSVYVDDIKMA